MKNLEKIRRCSYVADFIGLALLVLRGGNE